MSDAILGPPTVILNPHCHPETPYCHPETPPTVILSEAKDLLGWKTVMEMSLWGKGSALAVYLIIGNNERERQEQSPCPTA
jgi:hypothetical protein